jgi:hypothetical protein
MFCFPARLVSFHRTAVCSATSSFLRVGHAVKSIGPAARRGWFSAVRIERNEIATRAFLNDLPPGYDSGMDAASRQNPRRYWFRWWLFPTTAVLLVIISPAVWWKYTFPNGYDHCCDLQLYFALEQYAREHDGKFPSGGDSPAASLSMLYPKYAGIYLLRGKTYPEEPAAKLLIAGRQLTPETCGWHYVEGLELPREQRWSKFANQIAIFSDKVGSGHDAQRLPKGGHMVMCLNCRRFAVDEADWPRFLAEQEKAVAAIRRSETPEPPWIPDGVF